MDETGVIIALLKKESGGILGVFREWGGWRIVDGAGVGVLVSVG